MTVTELKEYLDRFADDVEVYEYYVCGKEKRTILRPVPLDVSKWKATTRQIDGVCEKTLFMMPDHDLGEYFYADFSVEAIRSGLNGKKNIN